MIEDYCYWCTFAWLYMSVIYIFVYLLMSPFCVIWLTVSLCAFQYIFVHVSEWFCCHISVPYLSNMIPQEPSVSGDQSLKSYGEIYMCHPWFSSRHPYPPILGVLGTWGFNLHLTLQTPAVTICTVRFNITSIHYARVKYFSGHHSTVM